MVQSLLGYTLKEWCNHREGIDETLDIWVWNWVTTGVGIKKWNWETKYTRYVDVGMEVSNGTPELYVDQEGNEQLKPRIVLEEKEVPVTQKIFDGPTCDYVFPEDLLIIGGKGNPNKADIVIHRQYVNASELWTLADRKVFDEEAVARVIESGNNAQSGGVGNEVKQERAQNAGKSSTDTQYGLDRYEILEAYITADVDGSGINSDVVAWVHSQTGELLRSTYLHRINKGGMKPFIKVDFHKRPGQDMGIGLIEILHPLSKEMDAMHNMRIDFGLISTMPFGFYRPTSSIEPEKIRLTPGVLIPVDNPQTDVYFPNLGNRTAFGFQEEGALMNMVERLTGVSELTLGVVSGDQGATRTATGTRALQNESNANLNVHLRRLITSWKQSLEYLLHMLQQRVEPGFDFRVTGEDGKDYFAKVRKRNDIAGDFDFEITADSSQSNPSVQQANASQILQMCMNPLLIQVGTVSPSNIFEAQKNMLKSMGILDWQRFITKPQQYRISITPEEELNRVIRGIPVPVTPEMDHEGYIAYFDFISKSDELLGQMGQEQVRAAAQQAQVHQQMLQALQAQAAQAANQQQIQINSSLGAQPGATPQGPGPGQ
jgi:hypothetical protein